MTKNSLILIIIISLIIVFFLLIVLDRRDKLKESIINTISIVSTIITLIIAVLVYDKFILDDRILEKKSEYVIGLLNDLRTTRFSISVLEEKNDTLKIKYQIASKFPFETKYYKTKKIAFADTKTFEKLQYSKYLSNIFSQNLY